jgi:glucose-6-phosphate 1-dehydrogenase
VTHGVTASSSAGIAIQEIPGSPILLEPAPEPAAFVILGATGDLTRRKLLPALYNLMLDRRLPDSLAIIGVGREPLSAAELRARLREASERFSRRKPLDARTWERLAAGISYVVGDLGDASTYGRLRDRLEAADRDGAQGNRVYYLAVPPELLRVVLERLHDVNLLYENQPPEARPWCRVVIEKPFGHDLESAIALNRLVGAWLHEGQVFRIDHYLAKETVRNILVFRFGNAVFEPLWGRKCIDHIQITAAESIGIEGRGSSYDSMGVLRDVVQSHLLLLLALCASEAPVSFAPNDVRDETTRVLRTLHPMRQSDVARQVVPAQYRGYRQEAGVAPGSRTPTYVAMKVLLDSWRWQGVPFYLRAGKRLARQLSEISIQFQGIPLCLFRPARDGCQNIQPNVLTLRLQPDEGISMRFVAKLPGDHLSVGNVHMDMSYATAFGRPLVEAYERLLLDVLRGDQTLFARRDLVEHAWRFITPVLRALDATSESPLPLYEPGSAGPREADELLARDGRVWRPLL